MVLVFLANGFEIVEATAPIDMLRRAKIEVLTVGIGGKEIESSCGIKVIANITEKEVNLEDAEMIVLPGGMPGTINLGNSDFVKQAIAHCKQNNKFMAAICAAPSVLGENGVLEGIKATCFPGFEDKLIGAEYTGNPVEVVGKIVTARGAGVAVTFGLALVELLKGKQVAIDVNNAIQSVEKY